MKRVEEIRQEILLQLYASRPLGLRAELIQRDAQKIGYTFTEGEITRELQFLHDEGLLTDLQAKGSTVKFYRILPEGIRHYEQNFSA